MSFVVALFGNDSRPYAKVSAEELVSLATERGLDITVRFIPYEYNGDVPKMIEALQGVDVITGPQIIRNAVEIAAGCPDLKLLQITSAGFDEFNYGGPEVMEGLRQHGVIFANNGGSNAIGVAETTIMLMLGVCKNMFELALMARSGEWTVHHTRLNVRGAAGARELSSQTVGIVGFGNIGRMVARYLQGFRCKVLYYDTEELMVGRDGELDAEYVPFDELLRRSDIVTVHVPNQPSTNGRLTGKKLFGKEQFDMMQEHAIYISTCRGPVTDEKALIDALNSGSIYGAGLDVLDPDPSPDSPLLDMENVIVLPHMAPVGTPPDRANGFLMDNLRRLSLGKPLLSVCNNLGHSDGIFLSKESKAPAATVSMNATTAISVAMPKL